MSSRGASIVPRQSTAQSPIANAGSPSNSISSSGSTPRSIASPNNPQSPPQNNNSAMSPPRHNSITTSSTSASSSLTSTSSIKLGVSSIMTSKEWVLPPRPKPGRKPSVDTPASKRKAQNRAAQRAFRERRATRVQELEQKLMEVEKEKDIKEMALVNTINKLKAENNFLNKNMEQLRQEMSSFKASQDQMKIQMQQQQQLQNQQSSPSQQQQQQQQHHSQNQYQQIQPAQSNHSRNRQSIRNQNPISQQQQQQQQQQQIVNKNNNYNQPSPLTTALSPTGSSYSLQQISPAPSADSPMTNSIQRDSVSQSYTNSSNSVLTPLSNNTTPDKLLPSSNSNEIDSSNFDCGICIKDECLCESVGLKDPKPKSNEIDIQLQEQINSFKTQPPVQLKRKRKAQTNSDIEIKEIDFTKQFATKARPMPDLNKLRKSSIKISPIKSKPSSTDNLINSEFNENSPMENCGFCSDDTPCVCREAAKEAARINASLNEQKSNTIIEENEDDFGDLQTNINNNNDDNDDDNHKTSLPPLQYNLSNTNIMKSSLPVMHPGPSVEIREITNLTPGAVPTVIPRRSDEQQQQMDSSEEENNEEATIAANDNSKDGCTGNPGTCKQCQMDPMSTLFCTTVASKSNEYSNIRPNLSRRNSKSSLTLNFGGPSTPNNNNNNAPSPIPPPLIASSSSSNNNNNNVSSPGPLTPGGTTTTTNGGMFIPCADAYKTLSRHKKFNSVDFSTLVGKLTTRGMQVEVQSVANVLRELDRRVYN
ncbi:uncharacterized protein KGF55_001933 [Candida pseudojiufengensis]|uniref:uncharacterized protein n=1 Tax=Candida pseudojiufengensis TaxID=497109 RepID=UPI002224F93D|nr:uncharacterized protein KGF55_001933 [Candida pseudojiufengensis]KAI5964862.1 hypothetical protein KGF55_001933 [Candida pseudojiufengensis]